MNLLIWNLRIMFCVMLFALNFVVVSTIIAFIGYLLGYSFTATFQDPGTTFFSVVVSVIVFFISSLIISGEIDF